MVADAEQIQAEPKARIFISYSRKDAAFVDRLEAALKTRGFEPLVDRTEIYAFEDWWKRIEGLIGVADTVIFTLSPDAIASDICTKEVAHAASLNKRFAPIVCRRVDDSAVPEALRRLNFVFFDDPAQFETSADRLAEALHTDIGWIRQHTEYGEMARHWSAAGRPNGSLLRSPMLEEAERWIASRPAGAPAATQDTQAFVAESRLGATRRRNILTGSLAAGLVLALVLAGFAYWQRGVAVEQRQIAEQQRKRAEDTLTAATKTANGLVVDLAQRFRTTLGMPSALVKSVLEQARNLQKELMASGQTTPALRASEAAALNEMGRTLLDTGDTDGALAACSQARDIYLDLLTEKRTSGRLAGLMETYFRIGKILRSQGHIPEALDVYQKELAVTEELAVSEPDKASWQRSLAAVDEKIGDTQTELRHWDEALASFQESLKISQKLSDAYPDNLDYQYVQAVEYNKIGLMFARQIRDYSFLDQAKSSEALDSLRKAEALFTKVTTADPNNTDWLRDLTGVYEPIGDVLKGQGKYSDALDAYKKMLAAAEKLSGSDEGNFDWRSGISVAHERIGEALSALGKSDESMVAYRKALAVDLILADKDPGNGRWQHSVLVDYQRIGNIFLSKQRFAEALETFQKTLLIAERLASANPTSKEWRRNLSITYERIGDALQGIGKPDDAMEAFEKSRAYREKLAQEENQNPIWQKELSISYGRIGRVLGSQNKLAEATVMFRKSAAIREHLLESNPQSQQAQAELAETYGALGDLLLDRKRPSEAMDTYRKLGALIQKLADGQPSNLRWQLQLARNQRNLGDALDALTRPDEALEALRQGLAILAKLPEDNQDGRRQRAVAQQRIGKLLHAQGRNEEAVEAYNQRVAIWQKLSDRDPANATELAQSYHALGSLLRDIGRLPEALNAFQAFLVVAEQMTANNATDSRRQTALTLANYEIGKVYFELGQWDEALRYFDVAIKVGRAPDMAAIYWERARTEDFAKKPEAAAEDMATAVRLAQTQARWVIWLHLARLDASQDDADELRSNAQKLDQSQWPWPIVAMFLGETTLDQVLAKAASPADKETRDDQICEADLLGGLNAAKTNSLTVAHDLLVAAGQTCPHDWEQFPATAKFELELLSNATRSQSTPD